MQRHASIPYFRVFTTAVLLLLAGSVAVLVLSDIAYINRASILETVSSADIRSAVILTLITSVITTILAVIVAIPSAYALSRYPFAGSVVLDVIVDLLIVVPVMVLGVSILVFFRLGIGFAASPNALIRLIGAAIGAMGDFFIYQRAGIVLTQFFCSVSFAVRVIKSTFDNIDQRTEQVAMTLGCTPFGAFWSTTLPMAKSGIIAGAVLAWARAFGLFGPISVVAGAVRQKTEVLSTSVFLEVSIGRLEVALAISLLMVGLAFLVLLGLRLAGGSNIFGAGVKR
jgi:molybdate transport system permease protein